MNVPRTARKLLERDLKKVQSIMMSATAAVERGELDKAMDRACRAIESYAKALSDSRQIIASYLGEDAADEWREGNDKILLEMVQPSFDDLCAAYDAYSNIRLKINELWGGAK